MSTEQLTDGLQLAVENPSQEGVIELAVFVQTLRVYGGEPHLEGGQRRLAPGVRGQTDVGQFRQRLGVAVGARR